MDITKSPKVSVVIPTFNRRELVGPALESVRAQTLQDIEVIIVDDASSDGTPDWIRCHFPEFQLLCSEQNSGASGARNRGLALARGDYVAFLDDDDQWYPGFLQAQVEALQQNPEAVLSFSSYSLMSREGRLHYPDIRPSYTYSSVEEHFLTEFFIHSMSLVMVRREALTQVAWLDGAYRVVHDCDFYLRLLAQGGFYHLPQVLVSRQALEESLVSRLEPWEQEEQEFLNCVLPRTLESSKHTRVKVYRGLYFTSLQWQKNRNLLQVLIRLWSCLKISPFWTFQIAFSKLRLALSFRVSRAGGSLSDH